MEANRFSLYIDLASNIVKVYLTLKIKAQDTLIGADWLRSDKREDDLGGRPGGVVQGSWIVKQSVGKKASLVGQALEMNYFRGKNYLELGIDVGSSTVVRGVVSLVLGYPNNLVIAMAFMIQGNTPDKLPEVLFGTCWLNDLDISKSFPVKK